jgi:excisionase family DNA binding protein
MDQLMTTEELAEFLQVPVATVYSWRQTGRGPRCARVGRHLRFRRTDVDAWLEAQAATA